MDQQTADVKQAREQLIAENLRLNGELTSEQRNSNELAAQIQLLVDAGM